MTNFRTGLLILFLAAAVPAMAGDAFTLPRKTWLRGEKLTGSVTAATGPVAAAAPAAAKPDLHFCGVTVPGDWGVPVAADGAFTFDTAPCRVGDYELRLKQANETVAAARIALRPAEKPEVWYGNFTGRPPIFTGDDPARDFRDLGMNIVYGPVPADEALAQGIYQVVHGNALRASTSGLPEAEAKAMLQQFMNCKGTTKPGGMPCLRNPQVIERAAEISVKQAQPLTRHPGMLGIGVDDEIGMRAYDWNDTGGVTCYCAACRQQWKAKTGAEPPPPVCLPPGTTVPDADPFLRYATEWTGWSDWYGPAEMAYNQAIAARVHKEFPGLTVFQTPGAPYGEMDAIQWEIYSYFFSFPATDALSAMSVVRALRREQGHANTPIWPLIGWFQFQAPEWTGNHIAAQSRMCLAEGAASIWLTIMYWYDDQGRFKRNLFHGADHLAPAVREIGELLRRFGPALIRVQPVSYPVAVLTSRTTEIYQRVIDPAAIAAAKARGGYLEDAWEHAEAIGLAFPALLQAGLPAEIVTEEEIGRGALKNYGALVLIDQKYARQSVCDRVNEFAAGGGVVFADKASPVRPAAAKDLPFDSALPARLSEMGLRAKNTISSDRLDIVMERFTGLQREWALLAQPIVDKNLPAALRVVESRNPEIVVRLGRNGDVDYVYLLSTDVRKAQTGAVSARVRGRFAYDFLAGATAPLAVVASRLQAQTELAPGGWQVYAVTPEPLAGLMAEAVFAGGEATVTATVHDAAGKAVNGAFPIQITVSGPRGDVLPYGGGFGTAGGRLVHRFRPALNDPSGTWKISVTNLTTGHSATTEFQR